MAWKFRASKYKNTRPIEPKFDRHVRELSIGSYHSCGNFIAASATHMAFNWDTVGASLAVLPLTASGRPDKAAIPRIEGHAEMVTDFAFSPFDDGLLLTGSADSTIKLWRIPETGLYTSLNAPEVTLPEQSRRVETVGFHPAVHGVFATSCGPSVSVWDVAGGTAAELYEFDGHCDKIQAVAWQQGAGRLLATQAKDRTLRILDPRLGGGGRSGRSSVVAETASHQGMKDSKVVWVDEQRVLTSGFGEDRARELILRDTRNLSTPQNVLSLDVSSGILIPLYDPDTNMVFLTGKGDRYIHFVEVQDREPWFVAGLRYTGEQIKGGCLIPKRAVDVMQCEVNRVLMLGNNSIVPIGWQVPRKSYREYHADVYPDTPGTQPGMGVQDWLAGANVPPPRVSLNPTARRTTIGSDDTIKPITKFGPPVTSIPRTIDASTIELPASPSVVGSGQSAAHSNSKPAMVKPMPSPKPSPKPRVLKSNSIEEKAPTPAPRPNSANSNHSSRPNSVSSQNEVTQSTQSKSEDVTDEAPTNGFRRQPSIRDKMKMFERGSVPDQKQEGRRASYKEKEVSVRIEKEMDMEDFAEDNKENNENKENAPMMVENSKVRYGSGTGQEEVILRPKIRKDKNNPFVMTHMRPQFNEVAQNRASRFGRVTKFRHMKGTAMHKSKHFDNLKNLSKGVPAECEYIQANTDRLAIPLAGPGGKLAILENSKAGRVSDGVVPAVINTGNTMDFTWDPFNNTRLAVVTDEGALNLWIIPENGLFVQVNKPDIIIAAHSDKASLVRFNPVADSVIATAAFDWLVKIWSLNLGQEMITLTGHTDQIYSMAWSQCGRFLATVCRDGKVRIYDPRNGSSPVREGGDIVAKKGARIVWALDGKYIIVSGFTRQSERQIEIYDTKDLKCLHTETLSVSPAILIPYYDEDSSTLFLSGKGEVTVNAYEIAEDEPHMFPLSPYKAPNPSQGFGFLPHKNAMDVRQVEFARAYRLTTTTIEPISFTVPRVKANFFQDDLFPPTRVLWEPVCTAETWFQGHDADLRWTSLQPEGMPSLSGNSFKLEKKRRSTETDRENKLNNLNSLSSGDTNLNNINLARDDVKNVHRDIAKSVTDIMESKIDLEAERLAQDSMEGVDQKEWDDDDI